MKQNTGAITKGTKIVNPRADLTSYKGCKTLEKVVLPSRLLRVEPWGFRECGRLHNVSIPDSVERIDRCAFALRENSAPAMDFVLFGRASSLERISDRAFGGMSRERLNDLPPQNFPLIQLPPGARIVSEAEELQESDSSDDSTDETDDKANTAKSQHQSKPRTPSSEDNPFSVTKLCNRLSPVQQLAYWGTPPLEAPGNRRALLGAKTTLIKCLKKELQANPKALQQTTDPDGLTTLHIYLRCGHHDPKIVEWMVQKHPAATLHKDHHGRFPIHYLSETTQILADNSRIEEIILPAMRKQLRSSKTDPEILSRGDPYTGRTPLHEYLARGHSNISVLSFFLKQCPQANSTADLFGKFPLHYFCAETKADREAGFSPSHQPACLRLLLQHLGPDNLTRVLSAADSSGKTPLQHALRNSHFSSQATGYLYSVEPGAALGDGEGAESRNPRKGLPSYTISSKVLPASSQSETSVPSPYIAGISPDKTFSPADKGSQFPTALATLGTPAEDSTTSQNTTDTNPNEITSEKEDKGKVKCFASTKDIDDGYVDSSDEDEAFKLMKAKRLADRLQISYLKRMLSPETRPACLEDFAPERQHGWCRFLACPDLPGSNAELLLERMIRSPDISSLASVEAMARACTLNGDAMALEVAPRELRGAFESRLSFLGRYGISRIAHEGHSCRWVDCKDSHLEAAWENFCGSRGKEDASTEDAVKEDDMKEEMDYHDDDEEGDLPEQIKANWVAFAEHVVASNTPHKSKPHPPTKYSEPSPQPRLGLPVSSRILRFFQKVVDEEMKQQCLPKSKRMSAEKFLDKFPVEDAFLCRLRAEKPTRKVCDQDYVRQRQRRPVPNPDPFVLGILRSSRVVTA